MKKKFTIGSVLTAVAFVIAGFTYKQRRKQHGHILSRVYNLLCNVRN